MLLDLTLALRLFRRQPSLTGAVVGIVGLAVAINTALFSVFDGLVFRPLPFVAADRIVHMEFPLELRRRLPREEVKRLDAARASTDLLSERGLTQEAQLIDQGAEDSVTWDLRPVRISPAMFALLGVTPVAGRIFSEADQELEVPFSALESPDGQRMVASRVEAARAGPSAVILSYELWQKRYGGDGSLIGQPIELSGGVFSRRPLLVGVLPRGFAFPDGANVWIPATASPSQFNYARLAPGVTVEQVRAALPGLVITPLRDYVRPEGAFGLATLLGCTALLLLVAWVQVGALLFSQAVRRAPEIGIRLSLGATRIRLMRQFALESALLAGAALTLAWLIAPAVTAGVVRLLPGELTRGQALAPDGRALGFASALSACGIVLLTLVPTNILRRNAPLRLLQGGLFDTVAVRAARMRTGLLLAQLAVTTSLVYLCGLAVQSALAVGAVDLGFQPNALIGVQMPPTTVVLGMKGDESREQLDRQSGQALETLAAVAALPGVTRAAFGHIPFSRRPSAAPADVTLAGDPEPRLTALVDYVTPEYVSLLGLRVVAGRVPSDRELAGQEHPALVNAAFAREFAHGESAVGRTVSAHRRSFHIAAVVSDFVTERPDRPVRPQLLALTNAAGPQMLISTGDVSSREQSVAAIRTIFDRLWPGRPQREVMLVSDLAARAQAEHRARAILLVLIAGLCAPLAGIGIAGAASFGLQQRTREFAIRMALGAEPSQIQGIVGRAALVTVAAGIPVGLFAGVLIGKTASAYLFGVHSVDPATMIVVVVLLLALGCGASWLPARRAARVDPATALREF